MRVSRGLNLVRVARIQIAIDPSWLVIFGLVLFTLSSGYFPGAYPGHHWSEYWAIGGAATLLFFLSVLVHELAHALVANRSGQVVRRITLFIFGGMAHLTREPRDPRTELAIAAVGPLTSLALGGAFWGITRWTAGAGVPELWVAMFRYLAYINVALAAFNLLPGFPLDGGRILRGILWLWWGDLRRATARAADWGSGIGFGLMGLGLFEIFQGALIGGLWLIFIGMFLRGAARASYQSVLVEQVLGGARVGDLTVHDPVVVPGDMSVSDVIEDHFIRHGYGGFPVSRDGEIVGLVSLRQIRECPPEERSRRRVRDIMRPADGTVTVAASAPLTDALRRMSDADLGRLLVVDDGRIVGLITRTGITRFVQVKAELVGDETLAA
jgi:Zn-dependent protease/predicted transcriptional regulator